MLVCVVVILELGEQWIKSKGEDSGLAGAEMSRNSVADVQIVVLTFEASYHEQPRCSR